MRHVSAILVLLAVTALGYHGARFEPPDGFIYHGCGWDGYSSQAHYDSLFPTGHDPLVLQVVADMPGTRWFDVTHLVQSLNRNIIHPDSQYIEFGLHFRGTDSTMLDSVFAHTTEMDHYVDTLAIALESVGRPFFLRIGFEFNGSWNPYHPYIFPLAFRKLVTELRQHGVPEFAAVWCYEPDAPADFADSTDQGWKWYPGDDVVDWCGLDPFDMEHFNPALPDTERGQLTPKGKSEAFLRFAEERRKPVYLNELSARHVFIVPDSLDPQGDSGRSDWYYWFEPFFQFTANHPDIKGWNYINLDWTRYQTYQDWGDARLEVNSEIRTRWVDSLMSARFLNAGYDIMSGVSDAVEAGTQRNRFSSTVVHGMLYLPQAKGLKLQASSLMDAAGRKVMGLQPGANDVSRLTSGVYFVEAGRCALPDGLPDISRFVIAR